MINIMINIFNLFSATRCCRDKRQGKKEDGGLSSSLIRVGEENSILDQRRSYEIKLPPPEKMGMPYFTYQKQL